MSGISRKNHLSMVRGDSITFNQPGTWTSPHRTISVNLVGKGGTGEGGEPGTTGNPGSQRQSGLGKSRQVG